MRIPWLLLAFYAVGLLAGAAVVLAHPAAPPSTASRVAVREEPPLNSPLLGLPAAALADHGLQVVGQFEADLTQDDVPETVLIATAAGCPNCDVRHIVVVRDGVVALDVEANHPQVTPLPGRYGLSIREPLAAADGPPCCDTDSLTHTFVWNGQRFAVDRRAEVLRDALAREVAAFVERLDPALRDQLDGANLRQPTPEERAAFTRYDGLLADAAAADGELLLSTYRRWWHDRLFDGLVGAVGAVPPRLLSDPRSLDDFVSWSLMRG
jgi:hypothetical protein